MNAPAPRWIDGWDGLPALVPVAFAATAGIIFDRYQPLPLAFTSVSALAFLAGWLLLRKSRESVLSIVFLLVAVVLLASWYAHYRREDPQSETLLRLASPEGTAVHLRGRVAAPLAAIPVWEDALVSIPRQEVTRLWIDVESIGRADEMRSLHGRVVAYVPGKVDGYLPGDELEMAGRLLLPPEPSNPGELDRARELRDQGIVVILSVPNAEGTVRLVARRWPTSIFGWLSRIHSWCKETLHTQLTAEPALASALLLGDASGLGGHAWEKFTLSGVVHALAISGQHLAVLAWFLMSFRSLLPVRLRTASVVIAVTLLAYVLMTGARASMMRAAWMSIALSGWTWLRRPFLPRQAFALAWVGVALANPADLFHLGCQLSFLAVAILYALGTREEGPVWTPWPFTPAQDDPFAAAEAAIRRDEWRSRPWLLRMLYEGGRYVLLAYLVNAVVWIGVTPMLAARGHVVSPVALLIGPIVVLLTSVSLLSGFVFLLMFAVMGAFAWPLAWLTDTCLTLCERVVDAGLSLPGSHFHLADVPEAWLWIFHLGLFAVISVPMLRRPPMMRYLAPLGAAWLILGLLCGLGWWRSTSARVTFLAVGHGGCTVLESSRGWVALYDAGAMTGPEITRRVIAPYLWSRGIRRIDELFLSHADLDHFNGVPSLLDRLTLGRVTLTPSFADRTSSGVRRVLAEFRRRNVPTRIVKEGDVVHGQDLRVEVLHPPLVGPDGKENARSLVLSLRLANLGILLTGDLEEAGLEHVLALRPPSVDVLMAPHHGSRTAYPARMASWAKPRYVISSQGRPRSPRSAAPAYEALGATYLTTWREGALTLTHREDEFHLESFRTRGHWSLGPAAVR